MIAAVALATAAPLMAAGQAAVPTPVPAESRVTTDTALDSALLLGESQTRMTVPVSIDAKGPWGFIIDTGAERTVVSRELAGTLGLQGGPTLRVIAMTGPSMVASVIVPSLSVSKISAETITAPALEQRYIGAMGMLGIDALQGHQIDIDFHRQSMVLKPSRRRVVRPGAHDGEVVVVARSQFGQLIVTDAYWRSKRIAVVIDTGSALTMGNPALLALIGARAKRQGPIVATSVTGHSLAADAYVVSSLSIGDIRMNEVPVAFADAAPFHRFGLNKRPALMLGMDTLRLFRRVRIDFANRNIQFTLPESITNGFRFGSGGAS